MICTSLSRGTSAGAIERKICSVSDPNSKPTRQPTKPRTTFSVRICRVRRPGPAPIADRTAISRPRPAARANCRWATLTHAMSSHADDGSEQQPQRRLCPAGQLVAHRCDRDRLETVFRMLFLETGRNVAHLGARVLESDARLEFSDDEVVVPVAVRVERNQRARPPDVGSIPDKRIRVEPRQRSRAVVQRPRSSSRWRRPHCRTDRSPRRGSRPRAESFPPSLTTAVLRSDERQIRRRSQA